jgi:hypothetical protein
MQLSREARVVAGVIRLTVPAIMYGGLTLLGILTGGGAGLRRGDLQFDRHAVGALSRRACTCRCVGHPVTRPAGAHRCGHAGPGSDVVGAPRRAVRCHRHLGRLLRARLRARVPVAGLSRSRGHGGVRAGHRHRSDTAPAGRRTGRCASPMIQDVLLAALAVRFGADAFRAGAPPEPVAVFPARHPEVGDAVLWLETGSPQGLDVRIQIGRVLHDHFHDYDTHLEPTERAARVTRDVVRFLDSCSPTSCCPGLVTMARSEAGASARRRVRQNRSWPTTVCTRRPRRSNSGRKTGCTRLVSSTSTSGAAERDRFPIGGALLRVPSRITARLAATASSADQHSTATRLDHDMSTPWHGPHIVLIAVAALCGCACIVRPPRTRR